MDHVLVFSFHDNSENGTAACSVNKIMICHVQVTKFVYSKKFQVGGPVTDMVLMTVPISNEKKHIIVVAFEKTVSAYFLDGRLHRSWTEHTVFMIFFISLH